MELLKAAAAQGEPLADKPEESAASIVLEDLRG